MAVQMFILQARAALFGPHPQQSRYGCQSRNQESRPQQKLVCCWQYMKLDVHAPASISWALMMCLIGCVLLQLHDVLEQRIGQVERRCTR